MMFLLRIVEEIKEGTRRHSSCFVFFYHGISCLNFMYILETGHFYAVSNSSGRSEPCDFQMKSAKFQSSGQVQIYMGEKKSKISK